MSILPLILEDVSVQAGGRTLLDRVSLEIGSGPKTVILGPNGAGEKPAFAVVSRSGWTDRWPGSLDGV